MGKSTPKFVNGTFFVLLMLVGCAGKEMPEEKQDAVKKEEALVEDEKGIDTVWVESEVTSGVIPNWQLDTIFRRNGELVQFSVSIQSVQEPCRYIETYTKNDTVFARKLEGPQFELSIASGTDSKELLSTQFTKDDLINKSNAQYMVADSYTNYNFLGYHSEFDAVLLSAFIGYPSSDDGVFEYIFLGMDGKIKKQFTDGHSYDICDCSPVPSPDGKTFSFCSGILNSSYQFKSVERDEPLAGIFQLGNRYSLAVYMYEGKPPYTNLKLLNRSGTVVKSFSFEGFGEGMSYNVLHAWIDERNILVLVDDTRRQLLVFYVDDPLNPTIIDFDDVKVDHDFIQDGGEHVEILSSTGKIDLYSGDGSIFIIE